jgi:hypothetical protein
VRMVLLHIQSCIVRFYRIRNLYGFGRKFAEIGTMLCRSEFSLHFKESFEVFPSPAGMSLTKLFLAGNNLIIPGQGEFGW